MGGGFHVDFLLLTMRGVVVVDLRDVQGNIFGGDQMAEWTVMDGPQRFTFTNPQSALYDRIAAVKAIAGEVPVEGRIVFTRRGKFPKGLPKWTLMLDAPARRSSFRRTSRRRPIAPRSSARAGSAEGSGEAELHGRHALGTQGARVIGEHQRDAGGELLRVLEVQELVRAVRVGVRTEDPGDEELRVREALAEHSHEGDRAAAADVHGVAPVDRLRGTRDRLLEPRREGRGVPAPVAAASSKLTCAP